MNIILASPVLAPVESAGQEKRLKTKLDLLPNAAHKIYHLRENHKTIVLSKSHLMTCENHNLDGYRLFGEPVLAIRLAIGLMSRLIERCALQTE